MKVLRLLVLLLLIVLFCHTGWACQLSSIPVNKVACNDNYSTNDDDADDYATFPIQLATLQDASSPGQISVRPVRLLNIHGNSTLRHTGKSSFLTRILNFRKNKKHLRQQVHSSSLGGCASCDYYVIALRHIVR